MTKRILALLLCCCTVLSLAACGSQTETKMPTAQGPADVAAATTPPHAPTESDAPAAAPYDPALENVTSSIEDTPKTFWNDFAEDYPDNSIKITAANSFNEGVTWVVLSAVENLTSSVYTMHGSAAYLINKSGDILCKISSPGNIGATACCNGVSLVEIKEGEVIKDTMLVTNDGAIVWSTSKDGWAEADRLFGKSNVTDIEVYNITDRDSWDYKTPLGSPIFNGFCAVYMHIESYEMTGYASGLLGSDGKWLVEPSKDSPEVLVSPDLGACYAAVGSDRSRCWQVINLLTKETVDIYDVGLEQLYGVRTLEQRNDIVLQWQEQYEMEMQDGLKYDAGNLRRFDVEKAGFINAEGEQVISLANYKYAPWVNSVSPYIPRFSNGYCVLSIQNPNFTYYITVIDRSGNQMFSPIKYSDDIEFPTNYRYGYVSDGVFLMTGEDIPALNKYHAVMEGSYINLNGEELNIADGAMRKYPFSEGLALIYDFERGYRFIDIDGNDVFPHN